MVNLKPKYINLMHQNIFLMYNNKNLFLFYKYNDILIQVLIIIILALF